MQKGDILEKVRSIIANILRDNKIELVDIVYKRRGRDTILSILADTAGGITLNECAKMNEIIGETLDKEDIIEGSYLLEISSPGLDRPLKKKEDFIREIGKKVRIHTYSPVDTFDRLSITQSPLTSLGMVREVVSMPNHKQSASRGENKKEFIGILDGFDGENISIITEKGVKINIALDKIASARLHFDGVNNH